MRGKRLLTTIRLCMIRSSFGRAKYMKEHNIFFDMGEGCSIMNRTVPLYPKLIRFGNNVHVASNVGFVTHDITHMMLNRSEYIQQLSNGNRFQEKLGCIDIGDNVFIGSGTRILYDVKIGSNVVIGSGSIVNRDIPNNCVAAGIPAKVIGSIEDYTKKRLNDAGYPAHLRPQKEDTSEELNTLMWNAFDSRRKSR